jgi:uncharacterized protein (TIGR02145 family)
MKTARLFFPLPCRAKSRRDGTLLTVCDSLRTFSLREILLPALMFFFCANLSAQVTMGGLEEPKSGAILDLNSTVKGGLLLSNVELLNLYSIPHSGTTPFPGVTAENHESVKGDFAGALVYHTGENGIPAGIYVWNGTNWSPVKENCTPLDAADLKVTPEIAFAKAGDPVTFSVSSGAGSRCAEGETYDWHVNGDPSLSATSVFPASTWTASFSPAGTYKVQVRASNLYSDPSSKVLSNEATVYVTDDGGLPPVLVNGNYGISGGTCYDVKGPQKGGESDADYAARVDSFANNSFTKTFRFNHTQGFMNLSVLMPDDPVGIVASVSQPESDTGSNSGSISFTVTFKNDVKQLVVANNAPVAVKLLVSYTDNNSDSKMASLDIRVQDAGCYCPARVPTSIHPSGWLTFMCKNLGATKELRSVADLAGIDQNNFYEYHGNWYRFGVKDSSLANVFATSTGSITNWNASNTASFPVDLTNANWLETANGSFGNPCPSGWRLPTHDEWGAVINLSRNGGSSFTAVTPENNVLIPRKGTAVSINWERDDSNPPVSDNYKNILQIGDYLFLPVAGRRDSSNGTLCYRGYESGYWSSTGDNSFGSAYAWMMNFDPSGGEGVFEITRTDGFSVRCVAE